MRRPYQTFTANCSAAPCVQVAMLKAEEAAGAPPGAPRRPRALVLGPTRELTDQLLRVAKALAHHEKFRSVCVNGGAHALIPRCQQQPRRMCRYVMRKLQVARCMGRTDVRD